MAGNYSNLMLKIKILCSELEEEIFMEVLASHGSNLVAHIVYILNEALY